MKYFAYGSNMSLSRLRDRATGAERLGLFVLAGHQLRFHKISEDGSGKCDAFKTQDPNDSVIGALFEISNSEKKDLDIVEGLGCGYEEKTVYVHNDDGVTVEAIIYYATKIDPGLKPYSWYLNHVLIGAREIKVPEQYLLNIEGVDSAEDPDKNRDAAQRILHG